MRDKPTLNELRDRGVVVPREDWQELAVKSKRHYVLSSLLLEEVGDEVRMYATFRKPDGEI